MRNTQSKLVVLSLTLAAIAGCGYEVRPIPSNTGSDQPKEAPKEKETVRERETVVVERPKEESKDKTIVVLKEAPPAPKAEVVVVRPSEKHVWVAGYWRPSGKTWVWTE